MDKYYIHYKVWGEITHRFPNFIDANNFIPTLYWTWYYLYMQGLKFDYLKNDPQIDAYNEHHLPRKHYNNHHIDFDGRVLLFPGSNKVEG